MGTPTAKSFIDGRAATDKMIFQRALIKMYGLSAVQNHIFTHGGYLAGTFQGSTIQNIAEGIMPDGTIAKNDDDIRLIKGEPLRTPTGVIEYREETPDENFPLKVPLESIKYDAESFNAAVDTYFEEYELANIPSMDAPPLTSVNVLDNPLEDGEDSQTILVDWRDKEEDEEEKTKTANEVYGDKIRVLTQINAAGDLTGVDGDMFVIWKGFKYQFQNQRETTSGNYSTMIGTAGSVSGGEQIYPPYDPTKRIAGLTNSVAGRNLEVFLKDRNLNYKSIEIVPLSDIEDFPPCTKIIDHMWHAGQDKSKSGTEESLIKWGSSSTDGYTYNTNTVEYKEVIYEPGDIIKGVRLTTTTKKVYLPDQHARWTEYHPHKLDKPVNESSVYKPDHRQRSAKGYEGVLVRAYIDGKKNSEYTNLDPPIGDPDKNLSDYFMILRGSWFSIWPWSQIPAFQGNPPSKVPDEVSSNDGYMWNNKVGQNRKSTAVEGYHGNSYKVMNWDHMQYIGVLGSIVRQDINMEAFITSLEPDMPYHNFMELDGKKEMRPSGGGSQAWSKLGLKPQHFDDGGYYVRDYFQKAPDTVMAGVASVDEDRDNRYNRNQKNIQGQYFSRYPQDHDNADYHLDDYTKKNGYFRWPYDTPGIIHYKAQFGLKNTRRANKGGGARIRVVNENGATQPGGKSWSMPSKNSKNQYYHGTCAKWNVVMNKGDYLIPELHANGSDRKLRGYCNYLRITIALEDIHDTVELHAEAMSYFGIVSSKGGMVANDYADWGDWRQYIKEGDYYDKPHLEKYNELFNSNKVPATIKKTV